MKKLRTGFLMLALVALAVASVTVAQAQADTRGTFTGTLDANNARIVVVSGIVFALNNTDVDPDLTLVAGEALTVEFIVSGGTFTATRLSLPETDGRGVGRISGDVELTSGTTVIVGGLAFSVGGVNVATDAVYKVGNAVDISFFVDGGSFRVTDLELFDYQHGFIVGTVDNLKLPQIIVGGVTFDAAEADIDDTEFALTEDSLVKLEFAIEPDGVTRAFAIQVRMPASVVRNSGEQDRVIVAGIVNDVSDDSITISGVTVNTSDARVDASVTVGQPARIIFQRTQGDNSALTPVRVRPLDDLDDALDDVIDNSFGDDDDDDVSDNCSQPSGWTTYRVRPGDTLGQIANRSGSSASELAAVNCLNSTNLIIVGQQLFVPRAVNTDDDNDDDDDDDDDDNDDDDDSSDDDGSDDDSGDDDGTDDQGGGNDDSDDDDDDGDDD